MNVVLIGSGNVATSLGQAIKTAGHSVKQIYSRSLAHAEILAKNLGCDFTDNLSNLHQAEVYMLAVSDDAIAEIVSELTVHNKLLLHTSGSTGITALEFASKNVGVVYPLQTFSKQNKISFKDIPIAIEANTTANLERVREFANSISERVIELNSEQRLTLHVAAVFACNFANHFYSIADGLLEQNGLSFDLLKPLIKETTLKVMAQRPKDVQTGPAVRHDYKIMNKHEKFLSSYEGLEEIYHILSAGILKTHSQIK